MTFPRFFLLNAKECKDCYFSTSFSLFPWVARRVTSTDPWVFIRANFLLFSKLALSISYVKLAAVFAEVLLFVLVSNCG